MLGLFPPDGNGTESPIYFSVSSIFQSAAMTLTILTLRRKPPKAKSLQSPKRSVSLREAGNGERRGEETLLLEEAAVML